MGRRRRHEVAMSVVVVDGRGIAQITEYGGFGEGMDAPFRVRSRYEEDSEEAEGGETDGDMGLVRWRIQWKTGRFGSSVSSSEEDERTG